MAKDASVGREVLPIPDRPHTGLVTYDAKDPATSFPPIEPLRPPGGAPNVLVVLIDDCGFGASSAFGGPVNTPTADSLWRIGCQVRAWAGLTRGGRRPRLDAGEGRLVAP